MCKKKNLQSHVDEEIRVALQRVRAPEHSQPVSWLLRLAVWKQPEVLDDVPFFGQTAKV